jgi:hypothetical protein
MIALLFDYYEMSDYAGELHTPVRFAIAYIFTNWLVFLFSFW